MRRTENFKVFMLILIAFALIQALNAQTETCQVLLDKISKEYKGDCKNGLANGKGKATGEDVYIGSFKNGLPDGNGKYIFKNGDIYQGSWKEGKKDGKGKFTFSINGNKQILVGYWKNDEYAGINEPDISYRVISVIGLMDYKINENVKPVENEDEISFSIKSAFTDFMPSDLKLEKSSGQIFQTGKRFGINHYSYPLHCEVSYSILVGQIRKQCQFIVDILKKGRYEVTLNND